MDPNIIEMCIMRDLSTFPQIYIYAKFVDFRKSINGLSQVVESEMKLKPFSDCVFVFMGRRKDRIKLLYWDKSGFALWYKRLEEAKFAWQREFDQDVILITVEELQWLLSGINLWKIKPHKSLSYESIS
jgi:transposase